jgi:hypothetical protein
MENFPLEKEWERVRQFLRTVAQHEQGAASHKANIADRMDYGTNGKFSSRGTDVFWKLWWV